MKRIIFCLAPVLLVLELILSGCAGPANTVGAPLAKGFGDFDKKARFIYSENSGGVYASIVHNDGDEPR